MNNEPGLIFLFVVAMALAFGYSHSGRYQLVQGHYTWVNFDKQVTVESIFKIDTETGQTWEYNPPVQKKDFNLPEYWHELPREPQKPGLYAKVHDWITSQLNISSPKPLREPPSVGQVVKGRDGSYRFLGGDPSKKENWEKQ